jgi:hypothetical protein
MPKKGIRWTEKQKAIADRLRAGASPQAVMAEGYAKKTVYKIVNALKAELKPKQETKQETQHAKQETKQETDSVRGQTHITPRFTSSVEVGQILIEPADWRVNQEGGLLIIGAYSYAKRTHGYTGTVGDFICDCANLVRLVMGLDPVKTDYTWKEDTDGRREEGSEGTDVPAEIGAAAGGGEP